jgi:hypothetical protein
MVSIESNTVSKAQIAAPEKKESKEKEVEKMFNGTHLQYPPPQKRWRAKTVVATQAVMKTEDETIATKLSAEKADRPTPKFGPSSPRKETSDNTPTPMDEGNIEEDDILGEGSGRLRNLARARRKLGN